MSSGKAEKNPSTVDEQQHHEGPLSSWNRRKQAVLAEQEQIKLEKAAEQEQVPVLTDEDMPPIDSLTPDSDYTGFLSSGVSEDLRRLALRKLFHGPEFNVVDGLDDYDGDYTSFAKLGDVITSEMRHRMEIEARRKLEQAKESLNVQSEGDGLDNSTELATEKPDVIVADANEVQIDVEGECNEGECNEGDVDEFEEDEDLSSELAS
jgi:hypothetical protein